MKIFRKIYLWIIVGLLALGQLQRIELYSFGTNISIYIHDLAIIFFLFHIFFTNPILYIAKVLAYIKNNKLLLFFLGILFFSLIINNIFYPDIIGFFYLLRLTTYILFGLSLVLLIKNNQYNRDYLGFQFFSIGLLSLLLGFIQFLFIKDTRFLSILGWDDHYARLISTYFDPGFTGIIFVLSLLLGLSNKYLENKYIKIILIIIFSWGIILTFSRSSYIALIIALAIVFLHKIEIKKIIAGLVCFTLLIFIAPKPFGEGVNLFRTSTITARKNAVTTQLSKLSKQTLLLGNGLFSEKNSLDFKYLEDTETNTPSTLTQEIIPSHSRMPDNVLINLLLSTGVLGLSVFLVLSLQFARILKENNIYLFAGFVALFVHSQFSNSLLQPFVLLIFLGSLATLKIQRT